MIKNILEYFENTLVKQRDKIAVIDGERQITFKSLAKYAWVIGTKIYQKSNMQIKQPVAVFIPKSIECIAADMGIVYSGNAYMNLDVKTPLQRINNILKLVQPEYIITTAKYFENLKTIYAEERLLLIDDLMHGEDSHELLLNHLEQVIDTDPFCLINTSGSTGTPKSVILNHKSFIDFVEWALNTTKWTEYEVIGSLSPAVFDIYSFELCMLMAKGSTIVVIPDTYAAFPVKILQLLQQHKVTFIFWVPTIMVNIANMNLISRMPLPDMKMVWFAGEVFPTKQFNYWKEQIPQAVFVNLYGPIEITLDCTYFIVDRDIPDNEPLPIGRPCRNTDILILDENDNAIKETGKEGELCVRGTSLAMGYYNNPEKTAAAFVQNPLNKSYPELIYRTGDIVCLNDRGEIMFKGRKDSLIKHSGYRIELTEIEHVIVNTLKLVKNGCAVYDFANKEIVFFYEAENEKTAGEFRKSIGRALPNYMIPTKFINMDVLPRNTNGKIDRFMLKKWSSGKILL